MDSLDNSTLISVCDATVYYKSKLFSEQIISFFSFESSYHNHSIKQKNCSQFKVLKKKSGIKSVNPLLPLTFKQFSKQHSVHARGSYGTFNKKYF